VIVSKPIKLPFSIHEGVLLQAALRRNLSIAESLELALFYCNRELRNGRLQSALVQISSAGKETVTLLNPSDWQQRAERNYVHADSVARHALLDLAVPSAGNDVVVALKGQGQ
jgi:hypothetical protein